MFICGFILIRNGDTVRIFNILSCKQYIVIHVAICIWVPCISMYCGMVQSYCDSPPVWSGSALFAIPSDSSRCSSGPSCSKHCKLNKLVKRSTCKVFYDFITKYTDTVELRWLEH